MDDFLYLKGLWFYTAQRHGSDELVFSIHVSWFSSGESVLLSDVVPKKVIINCIYWISSHNVGVFLSNLSLQIEL